MKKTAFIVLLIVVVLMRTSAISFEKEAGDQPRLKKLDIHAGPPGIKEHIPAGLPGMEGNRGSQILLVKRAADENKKHPRLPRSPVL
ncbi:hypothetical protein ACOMHN_029372 [Nucella lapillus]